MTAVRVTTPPGFPSIMVDSIWSKANPITNFTQRELNEGAPATERTDVRVLYDDKNLYMGVRCYDRKPAKIIANQMKRDFDISQDDNFEVVLDTYHDGRNGYLFVINPNGAPYDALVTAQGQGINKSWNGIWDARAMINGQGWFAEIKIPFSTLQFANSKLQTWGINFERNIRRKREQDLWRAYLRNYGLMELSKEGVLVGLRNINVTNSVWLRPYLLGGFDHGYSPFSDARTTLTKTGMDLIYSLSPALTLSVTTNTDFAQVEADQEQINLTRFPIYYPEKRQFFLEDSGIFNFQLGDQSPQIFYSRRIGLSDSGQVIPILGGARLVGKAGRYDIGVLSMETAASSGEPVTSYAAVRAKRELLSQSYVGFIATNRQSRYTYNRLLGFDGEYVRSDIFGTNTVVVGGALAGTEDPGVTKDNLAYRLYVDYPNDFINQFAGFRKVEPNFDPQLGFLDRAGGFTEYQWHFIVRPRPRGIGMQHIEFKPVEIDYIVAPNGSVESLWYEGRLLGFQAKPGEYFEWNVQRFAEAPGDSLFFYGDGIPPATYWWNRMELQFALLNTGPFSFFFLYSFGGFYNGHRQEIIWEPTLSLDRHFTVDLTYEMNRIQLPSGSFTANELYLTINYGFSPTLNLSLLSQWNDEDNAVYMNFRLYSEPNIYSNVYFVVNQSFGAIGRINPSETVVEAKLDYLLPI